MSNSSTWWGGLPLLAWPGVDRRALAWLLPTAPSAALVLDPRFVRPLRKLGCTLLLPDRGASQPPVDVTVPLVCADAQSADLLAGVRRCAALTSSGGVLILHAAGRDRERLAAAFLHAGLRDIQQVRSGRHYLTAGRIAP